ncbi:MAG: GatB/YqeY domain-containing protein [Firmicutes bacterium]|uniref:GatB/YqeY domain-containing protein n=1 Tax=Candidatus Stercoripulliclostridium pullicola TaxID=2840953 RepID=A0A940DIA8_9FIRM|nr:GatB/YqeY domain-containing protein [Candidatus Stercoripulliclostridium pullicola]
MLQDDIKKARIEAMKAKDKTTLNVLSVVLNKIMLATIDKREKGDTLTDADVVGILQKTVKELGDEREGFMKADRPEKVAELDAQIATVNGFLPKMMSAEEIAAVIMTLEDKSVPAVMRYFKAEYAGKCEMRTVSEVLKNIK